MEITGVLLTTLSAEEPSTLQEEPPAPSSSPSTSLTRQFRYYSTISAEILGLIFNTLTIVVYFKTPLRKSGIYLVALAVADNMALLAEMIRWFSSRTYQGYHWMDKSMFVCKFTNHLRYGSRLWSAFLTVTITIERYLAVAHPLKAAGILTRKSAKLIVTTEFVCSVLLSLYTSILFELVEGGGHDGCTIIASNVQFYNNCNWIISKAIGEVTTSILVFIFTSLIIRELIKSQAFRKQQTSDKKGPSVDLQLTLMLVLVAMAFLLLRVPYTAQYYISHNRESIFRGNAEYQLMIRYRLRKILDVAFFFYTFNHSINFFLYCFSGSKFRGYLVGIFCKREGGATSTSSSMSVQRHRSQTELASVGSASTSYKVNSNETQTNGSNYV